MTKKFFAITAVSFLLVAAAAPLAAQGPKLTANVPFEFTIAGKTMPAGEYEVWRSPSTAMVALRGIDQRTSALSLVSGEPIESRDPASDTKLVFHRYGDRYFLRQVVNGYGAVAFVLPESRAEREMAKTATLRAEQVFAVLARR